MFCAVIDTRILRIAQSAVLSYLFLLCDGTIRESADIRRTAAALETFGSQYLASFYPNSVHFCSEEAKAAVRCGNERRCAGGPRGELAETER